MLPLFRVDTEIPFALTGEWGILIVKSVKAKL